VFNGKKKTVNTFRNQG